MRFMFKIELEIKRSSTEYCTKYTELHVVAISTCYYSKVSFGIQFLSWKLNAISLPSCYYSLTD